MKPPIGYALLGDKCYKNQTQTGFSQAAVKLFGLGDTNYKVGAIYIELEDLGDPEDEVTPPTGFSVSEGLEYYDALEGEPNRDYIRVPVLLAPYADVNPAVPSNYNNRLTWYAETLEEVGVHGRTFSAASNSKVYGAALVVTPDWDDPSQDLIIGRKYYEAEDQFLCPERGGVRVGWQETFPV